MKKIVFLTLILHLFIIHCDGSKIVIKLWEFPRWPVGETADKFGWIKEQIRKFETENPHVKILLTQLSWEGGEEKRRVSIAAGDYPDVTTYSLEHLVRLIDGGLIEPVDEYLSKEDRADYTESALKSFTYKGKIYAFPWLTAGILLYLNVDIFKERKVELPKDGTWTYDEFVEKMKKLTFDRNQDGKIDVYGFAFFVQPLSQEIWPFLYIDGARVLDDEMKNYILDSLEGISGLQKLIDLVHKHKVCLPGCAAMTPGDIWQAFANDKIVACVPFGTWAIPHLRKRKFNFVVAHFPTKDKKTKPITFIGSNGFVVFKQKDATKKQLCMKLARMLTNAENQKLLKEYASFPTRKSAFKIYKDDTQMMFAQKILENGVSVPPHPEWSKIDEKIQRQLQLALTLKLDPKEVLTQVKPEIKRILDKYAHHKK